MNLESEDEDQLKEIIFLIIKSVLFFENKDIHGFAIIDDTKQLFEKLHVLVHILLLYL